MLEANGSVSHRAELEAVAPVREGRGAVAVLGGRLEGRDGVDAELARGVRRHVLDRRLRGNRQRSGRETNADDAI
eukprot:5860294-Pleurochrysis_carterae.AAC.3